MLQESTCCMNKCFKRQRAPSHSAFLELSALSLLQKLRAAVCCNWFKEAQEEFPELSASPAWSAFSDFSLLAEFNSVVFLSRLGQEDKMQIWWCHSPSNIVVVFPFHIELSINLWPGLHSPTPDFFLSCCHFLCLALPPLPLTSLHFSSPILWFVQVPVPLTAISVYWNHVYHWKLPDLSIRNQFLLPGVCSNNMVKAPFVVWLLGSLFHVSLSISSPAILEVREVIFMFGSQVPSTATAQS